MKTQHKIRIVHRANDWLCVDKPGGISVHNEPGRDLVSLLSKQMAQGIGPAGLLPVHRLDKETWGLLLLATDPVAAARLSRYFAGGQVQKKYKALVHGSFTLPEQAHGTWDTPLSKQASGRKDPRGKGKKVRAETRFKVVSQSRHYTLVDIELLTGRKHQIRRHAALAGHPVTGDTRYGSLRAVNFLKENCGFHTMGLQSCFIEFEDQGTPVCLELDRLPAPMAQLLAADMAEDSPTP